MSIGLTLDTTEGDNKEFAVDGTKTVNINIGSSETSANDTDTEKYFNNSLSASGNTPYNSAKAFLLRADQTITIIGINNITFTDPATVSDNKPYREEFNQPFVFKITIRTTQASGTTTKVYIRVK